VAFLSIPGHLLALLNDGQLQVVSANGEQFKKLTTYQVSDQSTWAPPVLLEDAILIKDSNTLTRWSLTDSVD
jgi:hypothetical protein